MDHIKNAHRSFCFILISFLFVVPHVWSTYLTQNFLYPKKVLVEFLIAFFAIDFCTFKTIRLPERRLLYLSILLFIFRTVATLWNFGWVANYAWLDGIAFGMICLYISSAFFKYEFTLESFYWPFMASSALLSGLMIQQFIHARLEGGMDNPVYYSSPFGNINITAEYMILLLPLALYFLRTANRWKSALAFFVTTSWIFFLIIGQCRSAWIGLFLIFVYTFFRGFKKREFVSYVLALAMFFGTWAVPTHGENYSESKKVSASTRGEIYKSILYMLAHTPMGVGGAQFEFSYLPYQMATSTPPSEPVRFDEAHDEFVKWGIENGWLYFVTAGLWWLWLFILLFKDQGPKEVGTYYRLTYLGIIPQLVFQFPFDNPASFMVMTFLFGTMFLVQSEQQVFHVKRAAAAVLVLFAVIFSVKGITQNISKWAESQREKDRQWLGTGCDMDPTNWRICFMYGMSTIESSFPMDSIAIAQRELVKRPLNYFGLRIISIAYIVRKDPVHGCPVARQYDSIFGNKSILSGAVNEMCKGVPVPVPFKDSVQYNEDYRKWVAEYLLSPQK